MRYLLPLILLVRFAFALSIHGQSATSSKLDTAKLGEFVDQLMAQHNGKDRPGGVVAVIQNSEIIFAKAYGMANLSHSIPNTPETIFNLGSVSKQFTGLAFAMLAEQDSLSLNDDVRVYLPEIPDFGPIVTLRNLLNHTSGYREVYGIANLEGRRGDILRRQEAIDVVTRQPELQFEPGSERLYNSTAYVLLTEIAERVTGLPYPDWMRHNVFNQLGMSRTMIAREQGESIPNAATRYSLMENGGYKEDHHRYAYYGATDIYTNVHDLAKWLRNFKTSELGGPDVIERMLEKSVLNNGRTLDYTLGLWVDRQRGLQRLSHRGGASGFEAYLTYYPEIDTGVAVLSNTGSVQAQRIGNDIATTFFKEHFEPEMIKQMPSVENSVTIAADRLDAYSGKYAFEDGRVLNVFREEESLFIQVEGQPRFLLVALSKTRFRVMLPGRDVQISFNADSGGQFNHGKVHQNGESSISRIHPWIPSLEELEDYRGRYFSVEAEVFYSLFLKDGVLTLNHRHLGESGLQAEEKDIFSGPEPVSRIAFERDADEQITGFRVSSGRLLKVLFEKQI